MNPGTKFALLIMFGLMIGLKLIESFVHEGGVLPLSWKSPLHAGLSGGVYACINHAYRLGQDKPKNGGDHA